MSLLNIVRGIRSELALSRPAKYSDKMGMLFLNHPAAGPAMFKGDFEKDESNLIRALFSSSNLMLNIGANTGYYALQAAQAGLEVIAVEADPTNVKFLLRNISANGLEEKVLVLPLALGNRNTVVSLHGGSTGASLIQGWAGQSGSQLVPLARLDDVVGSRLTNKSVLAVIDVEGAELEVLQGGLTALGSAKSLSVVIEVNGGTHDPRGHNPNYLATFELLFGLGLKGKSIEAEPVEFDLGDAIEAFQTGVNLGHNFLFER